MEDLLAKWTLWIILVLFVWNIQVSQEFWRTKLPLSEIKYMDFKTLFSKSSEGFYIFPQLFIRYKNGDTDARIVICGKNAEPSCNSLLKEEDVESDLLWLFWNFVFYLFTHHKIWTSYIKRRADPQCLVRPGPHPPGLQQQNALMKGRQERHRGRLEGSGTHVAGRLDGREAMLENSPQ